MKKVYMKIKTFKNVTLCVLHNCLNLLENHFVQV